MEQRRLEPDDPRVLERVLKRIENMSHEELVQLLSWRPEGVAETWSLGKSGDEQNTPGEALNAVSSEDRDVPELNRPGSLCQDIGRSDLKSTVEEIIQIES